MEFRNKAVKYLKELGVTVERVEQRGEDRSIVCHIPKSDNEKITENQSKIENGLDVVVALSDFSGFNVVIIEANDLE
jgi:hypothetical protein